MGAAKQRRRRRWRKKGGEQGRRGNGLGLLFVPAPQNLPAPTREGDLTFLHLFCHISQFSHGERENSESPTWTCTIYHRWDLSEALRSVYQFSFINSFPGQWPTFFCCFFYVFIKKFEYCRRPEWDIHACLFYLLRNRIKREVACFLWRVWLEVFYDFSVCR